MQTLKAKKHYRYKVRITPSRFRHGFQIYGIWFQMATTRVQRKLGQNQGLHLIQFTIRHVTQEVKRGKITNNLLENRYEKLKNKKPTRCYLLFLFFFLDTQQISGINMPDTCWVSKKKNKNSKWHLVGFYSLAITRCTV